MKKLLPLLIVLLLLLAACGNQTPQNSTDTPSTTEPPKGLYDPTSAVEKETFGAVRAYRLEQNDYFGLTAMGSRLLLQAEDGTLTALQGDTCVVTADLEIGVPIGALSTVFDSSVQGAAYYLRDKREVVLVNPQLQETDRIVLPEDIQGDPYISLSRGEIFYCVPGEIRALNTENGISRLIRSHSYPKQYLFGTWFDGELLRVCLESEDGTDGKTEYISADTGKTLYGGDSYLYPFHTWQDTYVLHRLDGGVGQFITGTRDSQAQALLIQEEQIASALPLGGVVGYTAGDDNIAMRYYDLESGRCTAHVTLHGVSDPKAFLATEDHLWILAYEGEEQLLYRWDITKSPANDDTVYTTRLVTADDPDTEGLEMCRQRAQEMGKQYGVKIHVWEDALEVDGGYPLVAEYQVETIHTMLDELELALRQFPENFLLKTVEAGWIHINLVRQVDDSLLSTQYWHEGDCYIAISHRLNVTDEFYRGLAYAIDSHVLGNSRKLDTWNDLNPEGFAYTYSDEPRQDQSDWLGEGSAFLSVEALHYPHHDRAAVFFYAITEAGADVFASEVLQAKLERLCRGIREAYGLEKSPDTYLWEQYLTEPLAYTK